MSRLKARVPPTVLYVLLRYPGFLCLLPGLLRARSISLHTRSFSRMGRLCLKQKVKDSSVTKCHLVGAQRKKELGRAN